MDHKLEKINKELVDTLFQNFNRYVGRQPALNREELLTEYKILTRNCLDLFGQHVSESQKKACAKRVHTIHSSAKRIVLDTPSVTYEDLPF